LWAAQDVVGESFGAVMVGALAKWLTPLTAITLLGLSTVAIGSVLAGVFKTLRTYQQAAPEPFDDEFGSEAT
jgi:hypothetical protein